MTAFKTVKNLLLTGVVSTLLVPGLNAQELAVPHTFQAGSVAKANEVNENFLTLAESINVLEARLASLESEQSKTLVEKLAGAKFEIFQIGNFVAGDSGDGNFSDSSAAIAEKGGYGLLELFEGGAYQYYIYSEEAYLPFVGGGELNPADVNISANGEDANGDGIGDGEVLTGSWEVTESNSLVLFFGEPGDQNNAYYFRMPPSGDMLVSGSFEGDGNNPSKEYSTSLWVGVKLPTSPEQ